MMKAFVGKGVYGAIAAGTVSIFRKRDEAVRRIHIEDTEAEKQRVELAMKESTAQLQEICEKAGKEAGKSDAAIFEIHRILLNDDDYHNAICKVIEDQQVNAEYAVSTAADNFSEMFLAMEDGYMRARAADIRDISDRMIRNLTGVTSDQTISRNKAVICASEFSPSEIVSIDKEKVLAFVTERGSLNSHTAILVKDMNIPAVFGVGKEFLSVIKEGGEIIVDGFSGEVFFEPDEETRRRFVRKAEEDGNRKRLLQELKGRENVTRDGKKIDICANIGSIDDVSAALSNDAGGIGLFRTEFLYLEGSDYPTEEKQFIAYKRVLESMKGKKVIIRTLDIGADKKADYFQLKKEENPALGYRAIRICLTRPELFRTQLRALYRASVFGNLGIMFPMLTSVSELKEILAVCTAVREELAAQGIRYGENVELGIMIETPAAALISDRLAPMVDFFSIGTNDLTQYTLACDRLNPDIERFVDPHHEAVLRLIGMSAENAHKYGVRIGICGELAADMALTETFMRMGIDELSVSPSFVLPLRDFVRKIKINP